MATVVVVYIGMALDGWNYTDLKLRLCCNLASMTVGDVYLLDADGHEA